MNSAHIYMFLALLSFGALGIFHKLADVKQSSPRAITAVLYLASFLFLFVTLAFERKSVLADGRVATIGLPFGIMAGIALLAFQAGIRHGNIATSWLAINLSSAVPTVASILIYKEAVTPLKAGALLLIPVALVLLWKDRQEAQKREGPTHA
jgi:EamA domain-containing membrane protein RarD